MSHQSIVQAINSVYKISEKIFLCLYSDGRLMILPYILEAFQIKNQCVKQVNIALLQRFLALQEKILSCPWKKFVKYKKGSTIDFEYKLLLSYLREKIAAISP